MQCLPTLWVYVVNEGKKESGEYVEPHSFAYSEFQVGILRWEGAERTVANCAISSIRSTYGSVSLLN